MAARGTLLLIMSFTHFNCFSDKLFMEENSFRNSIIYDDTKAEEMHKKKDHSPRILSNGPTPCQTGY